MFSRSLYRQVWKCGRQLTQANRRFADKTTALFKPFVQNVKKDHTSKMLHIHWENNTLSRFPYIYLRDNCQCADCFHESAKQRTFDTVGLADINVEAEEVKVSSDGAQISIVWPDKHVSLFEADWLRNRCLSENSDGPWDKANIAKKGVELWDRAKLQDKIPEFQFQELMEDDFKLMCWLNTLHSFGIALVKYAPTKEGQNKKLAERVGYLKPTHYGDTFQVHSKYHANNLAYTSAALALHTDLPQCNDYPGIQMLHCIEQAPSTGGSNMFVDGFNVSQKFKEAEPGFFQLLATVPIAYNDVGTDIFGEFNMQFSRPMIELDHTGSIVHFSFNNHARDSFFSVLSPEKTYEVYKAYIILGRMMHDPVNRIDYKMSPGEITTFNNSRILHGRTEFTITNEGTRFLEGLYLDWDIAYSKLRVLAQKYNVQLEV